MKNLLPGKLIQVTVEKTTYGGEGLARLDGRALFIPYALPGEEVVVSLQEDRGDYLRGRLVRVEHPSGCRRVPPCHFFPECGGCQIQHQEYSAQLPSKAEILLEMLHRQVKVQNFPDPQLISGPEWGYRRNVRFQLSWGPTMQIGFYRPRSREVVDLTECPLLDPLLAASFTRCRSVLRDNIQTLRGEPVGMKAICSQEAERIVYALLGRTRQRGEEPNVLSYFVDKDRQFRELPKGEIPTIEDQVGKWRFRMHPLAFFQSNCFLAPELLKRIDGYCRESVGKDVAVDLFAGAGFFSLSLASHFNRTISVEQEPFAAGLARENARLNGIERIEWFHQPVESMLDEVGNRQAMMDLVLVDPPREGLSRKVSEWVLSRKPARIIYVSCSPPTLVRDVKRWLEPGIYHLSHLDCLDMFPQTYHLETVMVLDRANG